MHNLVDKQHAIDHLVKVMNKPSSTAGYAGSSRNAPPRRNPGAAIAICLERSG
jgi:hypothetical protein